MKRMFNEIILKGLLPAFFIIIFLSCQTQNADVEISTLESSATILKDYVHAEDPTFRYEIIHSLEGEGFDYHVAKMYSQHWLKMILSMTLNGGIMCQW